MHIYENFIKNIKKGFRLENNINYNESNKHYYMQIINILKLANETYEDTSINITKTNDVKYSEKSNFNHFKHIPIIIRKDITAKTKYYTTTIKFNIYDRSFIINILDFDKFFTDKNKIKMIYMLLFLCNYISKNNNCCKTLTIYIYMTDIKKQLPEKFKVLDKENINTAFTATCLSSNEICVYRKEEWFKCLIHECIHAFGFDFSQTFSRDNDIYASKLLRKVFPINFDLYLHEAYTETFALYINLLFKAYFSTNKKETPEFNNKVLSKTFNMLNDETYFSLFQCVKILNHYDIDYNKIHINDPIVKSKYDENTPAFSYFLIKTILIYNFNEFYEWCTKNNHYIINFDCNPYNKKKDCFKKIKNFCQIIIKHYNDSSIINDFNKMNFIFQKTKSSNIIYTNLQFTLYSC